MFREFKVGDLLDCSTTKSYNPNKGDLPNGNTPYVTRSAFNNGISGYFDDDSGVFMNSGNCITIGAEGGIAFYQPDDFIAGIKVYTLRHDRMTCEIGMYLCGALNTHSHIYSYTNARVLDKIKAETIQLPVKPGTDEVDYTEDDIDWAYMESYIHELEESYIHELEESYIQELDAYLKETGLDDYTLTDDEREVLEREPVFKEFEVGELFDVTQGRRLKKSDFIDGDIPFVMASSRNNGVVAYLSNPVTTNENFITADILGNVFYHDGFVGFGDDNCGLKLKNGKDLETIYLYLVGALSCFKSIASYGNKLRGKWYKEQFIKLPVKPGTDEVNYTEDDIDWDYMESYIRAMEKHVIADVVDYKNSEITTAKELVYV